MKNKLLSQLLTLSLILVFAFSITACNTENTTAGDTSNTTNTTIQTESTLASSTSQETSAGTQETFASTQETSAKKTNTEVAATINNSNSVETQSNTQKKQTATSKATERQTSSKISKSKAKQLALNDAGVKESSIYDLEIELDQDNGVLHYDISFEVGRDDYDYEINAKTGEFISIEKPKASSSNTKISKTQAKNIALNDANLNAKDITHYRSELEKDDGVWKYEISFNVDKVEYEYTINAESGKIIEREKDIDD